MYFTLFLIQLIKVKIEKNCIDSILYIICLFSWFHVTTSLNSCLFSSPNSTRALPLISIWKTEKGYYPTFGVHSLLWNPGFHFNHIYNLLWLCLFRFAQEVNEKNIKFIIGNAKMENGWKHRTETNERAKEGIHKKTEESWILITVITIPSLSKHCTWYLLLQQKGTRVRNYAEIIIKHKPNYYWLKYCANSLKIMRIDRKDKRHFH